MVVPIEAIRSPSTTMTAFLRSWPAPSTTRPARMALVWAAAGAANVTTRMTTLRRISCSCLLELSRDRAGEVFGRHHPSEWPEAQNPALERAIDAHVQRHDDGAARAFGQLLGLVPFARAHVIADRAVEFDFDVFGRSRVDPERVWEGRIGQIFNRCEPLFGHRQVLHALDGERPDLAVLG